MKSKVILALAVVGFAFAACVKEAPEGGKTNDGEKAWIALDISAPAQTRALNNPENDNGEPEESKVRRIMAIMFDASEIVTDVIDMTYLQSGAKISTKAFEVSKDAKSILVVVNPSAEFNARSIMEGSTTFNEVNEILSDEVDALTGVDGFMMTNAAGRLEPWNDDDIQNYTAATEAAAYGKRFALSVDRVVAKVRLRLSGAIVNARSQVGYPNNGILYEDAEWCLNVTNKLYFPVSKRVNTSNRTWILNDIYTFGSYRVDPNYGDETPNPSYERPNYKEHFNFIADDGVKWSDINWMPVSGINYEGHIYCLENTFEEGYSMHAYTTHAVLKVRMYPNTSIESPASEDQSYWISAGESWFSIFGMYYSTGSLADWITQNPNPDDGDALLNLFNGFASEVLGGAFTPLAKHEVNQSTLQAVVEQLESELGCSIATPGVASPGDYGRGYEYNGLNFYNHGYCYYQIMIKHDNDDDNGNNLHGEYGVVRNSLYDINIKSISGPGLPTIPDPETEIEIPNESDRKYLSVVININPWTWYEQTENL